DLRGIPAAGPCLVRRQRHHCPTSIDRQRLGLHQDHLATNLRRARHRCPVDPALAPPDQRQGRTIPPHAGHRVGLRSPLLLRGRAPSRLSRLLGLVQLPSAPHRDRRASPSSPCHQPHRTAHLGRVFASFRSRAAQLGSNNLSVGASRSSSILPVKYTVPRANTRSPNEVTEAGERSSTSVCPQCPGRPYAKRRCVSGRRTMVTGIPSRAATAPDTSLWSGRHSSTWST